MNMILRFILSSGQERRRRAVGVAVWLLRQIRDAENNDLERYSEKLEDFDTGIEESINLDYMAIEGKYLSSEHALELLDSALEDLEFVY